MDASNLLKPALARGELHCVGATTLDEYRKHVEKDAALARRFQPVMVQEPTVEDTIVDPARHQGEVRAAPRRADLRFRAGRGRDSCPTATSPTGSCPTRRSTSWTRRRSRLRMEVDSKPEELDALDRQILQMQIEQEALRKEDDRGHRATGSRSSRRNLAELQERAAEMTAKWQAERDKLERGSRAQGSSSTRRVPSSRSPSAKATSPRRASCPTAIIPQLEKQLGAGRGSRGRKAIMVEEAVRPEQIAQVVERWTGIPTVQDAGRRAREAAAHGRRAAQARHRSEPGGDAPWPMRSGGRVRV